MSVPSPSTPEALTMDAPAIYRILVRGRLSPSWSDRLAGMEIVSGERREGEGQPRTELRGQLLDQAALAGVLSSLYELHLPILSVEYSGPESLIDR